MYQDGSRPLCSPVSALPHPSDETALLARMRGAGGVAEPLPDELAARARSAFVLAMLERALAAAPAVDNPEA
jgi:hypothetical protein